MAQIICLANSWKLEERCIAGVDQKSGGWIRPVCDSLYPENGKIPESVRLIEGREPALLDILEIPLADTGNDFGFACENRSVLPGEWKCLDRVQPTDLIRHCVDFPEILHNSWKYVNPSYLQNLPNLERRTVQLVYVVKFSVEKEITSKGKREWRGTIEPVNGQKLSGVKITDPVFLEKLESGYFPCNPCLITVSLSMPYKPSDNWEGEIPCWKLIAGVIELPSLSNSDLILVEMMRINWSIKRGRSYLQETYNKQTRSELTVSQINEFLNYLKSL